MEFGCRLLETIFLCPLKWARMEKLMFVFCFCMGGLFLIFDDVSM
jgi:hypothetical protein